MYFSILRLRVVHWVCTLGLWWPFFVGCAGISLGSSHGIPGNGFLIYTKNMVLCCYKLDLKIIPNGITMLKDGTGRASGEAYVQFASMEDADEALKKHREKIEYRWEGDHKINICGIFAL